MIIIYKEFKEDKAEFTKKELEELLEKARKEGYNEGYAKGYSDGRNNSVCSISDKPNYVGSPTYQKIYEGDGTLSNITLA